MENGSTIKLNEELNPSGKNKLFDCSTIDTLTPENSNDSSKENTTPSKPMNCNVDSEAKPLNGKTSALIKLDNIKNHSCEMADNKTSQCEKDDNVNAANGEDVICDQDNHTELNSTENQTKTSENKSLTDGDGEKQELEFKGNKDSESTSSNNSEQNSVETDPVKSLGPAEPVSEKNLNHVDSGDKKSKGNNPQMEDYDTTSKNENKDISSTMKDKDELSKEDGNRLSSVDNDKSPTVEKNKMSIADDEPVAEKSKVVSSKEGKSTDAIKSIEKVMDEDGDEFIITMNDTDDSEEEIADTNSNAIIKEVPVTKPPPSIIRPRDNTSSIKSLQMATPGLSNITLPPLPGLPSLPPLPSVGSNKQAPMIQMPSSSRRQNKSMSMVNLYIPTSVNKSNISSSSLLKNVQQSSKVVTSSSNNHQMEYLKQKLNSSGNQQLQLSANQRSLLANSPAGRPQPMPSVTPQSSMEMMSLIRWEIANRIYHRPKFQHIQPDSELGPLAKLLFDLGNDLVRETVYNDLVRIQTYRKAAGKLSEKEAEDLNKLKDVQAELKDLVGPIKQNLKRKCRCGFKTESSSVLYNHQQYPHTNENSMTCPFCSEYETKQPAAFVYHLEAMHNMKGKIEDKQAFWGCNLCPYENNSKSKLTQHKFRCLKNFNLKTNLSQNSVIGMEVNFCLESILYKRKEPPRLMSQQITNMMTARQQQNIAPKPRLPALQQTSVRPMAGGGQMVTFNNRNAVAPGNMNKNVPGNQVFRSQAVTNKINTLINQNNRVLSQTVKNTPPTGGDNSGFEVCEICGGYVKDRKALRIHFYYAHRIEIPAGVFDRSQAPLYCATCFARFWTAQGLQKHLEVHKVTNPSGNAAKCIVCGHKVPNVLMHMRIVHSKELGSYLAACKCIFCGLVCSTNRGVESHMVAAHGIMIKAESLAAQTTPKITPPPLPKPEVSRGSMCVLCNLQFARNVDLTRHCMRVHHTCMKCGMVVSDKVSLDKHTCLKSGRGLRNCELCHEKGFHPAYHVKHIRDKHIKRCTVDIARIPPTLLEAALLGVHISDPNLKNVLKAAGAIQAKIVHIKPSETIEILSDDENSPKKKAPKRGHQEIEVIDSETESEPEIEADKKDKAYRATITKKRCLAEAEGLRTTRRRTNSTGCSKTSDDVKCKTMESEESKSDVKDKGVELKTTDVQKEDAESSKDSKEENKQMDVTSDKKGTKRQAEDSADDELEMKKKKIINDSENMGVEHEKKDNNEEDSKNIGNSENIDNKDNKSD